MEPLFLKPDISLNGSVILFIFIKNPISERFLGFREVSRFQAGFSVSRFLGFRQVSRFQGGFSASMRKSFFFQMACLKGHMLHF